MLGWVLKFFVYFIYFVVVVVLFVYYLIFIDQVSCFLVH